MWNEVIPTDCNGRQIQNRHRVIMEKNGKQGVVSENYVYGQRSVTVVFDGEIKWTIAQCSELRILQ